MTKPAPHRTAGGPQPLNVPANPDPSDGWSRLYAIFREGRAATIAWNAEYLRRNGLEHFADDPAPAPAAAVEPAPVPAAESEPPPPEASPLPEVAAEAPPAVPEEPPVAAPSSLPLVAYTDGSGTIATLPCGAGVVVFDGDEAVLEASRHLGAGTNNHAELSAIRVALAITQPFGDRPLVVRTDSMYAIGALSREPREGAANRALILATRRLMAGREVRFEHVKGHSGIEGNERADELAGLARLRAPRAAEGSAAA